MKKILIILMLFSTLAFANLAFAEPPTGINLMHDVTIQMVTCDITSFNGQVSDADSISTADTWYVVFLKTFDLVFGNQVNRIPSHKFIIDVYFNIECEFRTTSSATADIAWKAQARNKNGTWIDLSDSVYVGNVGTIYTASNLVGYFAVVDNFDEIPFDFRILLRSNEIDEGTGRVKSGSYARTIFRDITWGI